jgi:hypothetical protein
MFADGSNVFRDIIGDGVFVVGSDFFSRSGAWARLPAVKATAIDQALNRLFIRAIVKCGVCVWGGMIRRSVLEEPMCSLITGDLSPCEAAEC